MQSQNIVLNCGNSINLNFCWLSGSVYKFFISVSMNTRLFFISICWVLSATVLKAQNCGCTDPLAANFNPSAVINDGTCVYAAASILPLSSFILQSELNETSGLIKWNSNIWTHADNSSITIYGLDTLTGNIVQTKPLNGVINIDWEEISQDAGYVYIGDFGNNGNGNRMDLRILRIEKNSLLADAPQIDTIAFSYSNQTGFAPTGSNNTDFDCEAFVVSSDSIYLFTKQWVSEQTGVYALPKTPGVYIASLQSTYNVNGLITGSVYLEDKRLVALCGYSSNIQPFVLLLYDFSGRDFFSGNKRKIGVSLPFHQIEGITTSDGLRYYMSNEYLSYSFITNLQKLHIFDFYSYLSNYLHSVTATTSSNRSRIIRIYPNPISDELVIEMEGNRGKMNFEIVNASGQVVFKGEMIDKVTVEANTFAPGVYWVKVGKGETAELKMMLKE